MMTSFSHFKSIFNSSFEFYGLSQWLFESMPNNVDLNPQNINRSNTDWIFHRHNARSIFICRKHNRWSSAYTTILFRARLDRQIGRIQMKIFEQACHSCNTYIAGLFDDREIKKIFYWLYIWILKTFYHIQLADDVNRRNNNRQSQYLHDSNRCDSCRIGWCKYTQRKRHTIMFE